MDLQTVALIIFITLTVRDFGSMDFVVPAEGPCMSTAVNILMHQSPVVGAVMHYLKAIKFLG